MLLLADIFDIDLGARPATYVEDYSASTPIEHEIVIAFSRNNAPSSLADFVAENSAPAIWAKTTDLPNLGRTSQIIVHYGYLEDENGNPILDQAGQKIIAENEYTYYYLSHHTDPYGITEIQLTLDIPN